MHKKITKNLTSIITAFVFIISAGSLVYAADEYVWHSGSNWYNKSIVTVDHLSFNDNYFVKVENPDYNAAADVRRTVAVKPYTKYRFSAMVKVEGFLGDPEYSGNYSGARIGAYFRNSFGSFSSYGFTYHKNSDWTLLQCDFETENQTEVELRLGNSACKGTAFFTNIKLEELPQTVSKNIGRNDYSWYAAHPVNSYLNELSGGVFERVEFIENIGVVIEKYNSNETLLTSKVLASQLPIFGGAFAGSEYNFLVFGQENSEESNDKEVIRVVKYSKDWEEISHTSLYGENTEMPFRSCSLRMAETPDSLVIHTGHRMFKSSDGRNHQANMAFIINKSDMTFVKFTGSYTSHSFNQFVKIGSDAAYFVDHGDAYPRTVKLAKVPITNDSSVRSNSVNVLTILGATGDNATGVCVGGFELSDYGFMIAGNTVDQTNPASYDPNSQRNIFISAINSDMNYAPPVFLTNYSQGVTLGNPYLVKIHDGLFAVMWEETANNTTVIKYLTVDSRGNIITPEVSISSRLSDCQPMVVNGNRIMWYYTDNSSPVFVMIDFNGKIYTGHNLSSEYSSDNIGHWFSCNDCSVKYGYSEHIVNVPKATAAENQHCVICGYVTGRVTEIPGDVNGDGKITATDLIYVRRYLSHMTSAISPAADMNGDGKVTAVDLILLRRKYAGL